LKSTKNTVIVPELRKSTS